MTGPKGVPEIVNLRHLPEEVRYRASSLSTHMGAWAQRGEHAPDEARTEADLVLHSVDELLAALRRLRRRVVRERRAYDDRD